ncbi:minor capsid protein [Paenalkalicoccus suaedae]|uniref:Minor capsid protein n=1 Tax=Paenalkalicoccus suaedae TaxID=2592382 RepID=A0A859FF49_9BACI|nr:putative minor capsid protein [Paenalkalicoccus suaedae]QKS71663.1 minor capsid protein [Paenalkalicoccus suaedae]QKS71717.1 minor capsid protein [Paenalkalicoccus suaedae]
MARPIPKRLLPHTIGYKKYLGKGREGIEYAEEQEIKHVRMEPSSSLTRDNNGQEVLKRSTLFIDARNSDPVIKMSEQDIVVFDEDEYIVNKVDSLYARSSNVHHYENEMI